LEIADTTSLEDKPELARLDARLEFLQRRHQEYEVALADLEATIRTGNAEKQKDALDELDRLRDLINAEAEAARQQMRDLLDAAAHQAVQEQALSVRIGLGLLALALVLGALTAAIITVDLVRSLRRLLHGTVLVQQGALDTELPVTSRDEVGQLTAGFNAMV